MDDQLLIEKIINVLTNIQEEGLFTKVELTVDSCPIMELPEFDSQIWVTAVTMIGNELEVSIPLSENIFRSEDGAECLKIREVAERILQLTKKGGEDVRKH
jgi:hypothetical protein